MCDKGHVLLGYMLTIALLFGARENRDENKRRLQQHQPDQFRGSELEAAGGVVPRTRAQRGPACPATAAIMYGGGRVNGTKYCS